MNIKKLRKKLNYLYNLHRNNIILRNAIKKLKINLQERIDFINDRLFTKYSINRLASLLSKATGINYHKCYSIIYKKRFMA